MQSELHGKLLSACDSELTRMLTGGYHIGRQRGGEEGGDPRTDVVAKDPSRHCFFVARSVARHWTQSKQRIGSKKSRARG